MWTYYYSAITIDLLLQNCLIRNRHSAIKPLISRYLIYKPQTWFSTTLWFQSMVKFWFVWVNFLFFQNSLYVSEVFGLTCADSNTKRVRFFQLLSNFNSAVVKNLFIIYWTHIRENLNVRKFLIELVNNRTITLLALTITMDQTKNSLLQS